MSDRITPIVEVFFGITRNINSEYSKIENYIDKNEKVKAARLRFAEDRYTYLLCHTLLRLILSKKLNTKISGIRIIQEGTEKPHLKGNAFFFNISHTRDAFAFAISQYTEVGVDLEKVNINIDFKSIITRFFSKEESKFIFDAPEDSRNRFFLVWTRKEALLKAKGTGIISDLSTVEVVSTKNLIRGQSCENMIEDSEFRFHHIYSKKLMDYYLSVAVPQETNILLHTLDTEKIQSYIGG